MPLLPARACCDESKHSRERVSVGHLVPSRVLLTLMPPARGFLAAVDQICKTARLLGPWPCAPLALPWPQPCRTAAWVYAGVAHVQCFLGTSRLLPKVAFPPTSTETMKLERRANHQARATHSLCAHAVKAAFYAASTCSCFRQAMLLVCAPAR